MLPKTPHYNAVKSRPAAHTSQLNLGVSRCIVPLCLTEHPSLSHLICDGYAPNTHRTHTDTHGYANEYARIRTKYAPDTHPWICDGYARIRTDTHNTWIRTGCAGCARIRTRYARDIYTLRHLLCCTLTFTSPPPCFFRSGRWRRHPPLKLPRWPGLISRSSTRHSRQIMNFSMISCTHKMSDARSVLQI